MKGEEERGEHWEGGKGRGEKQRDREGRGVPSS